MDTVKAEKETAIRRYRRIRYIWRLLRCAEACAALLAVSWYSPRLPDAARISGDFLRSLAAAALAPRFVFLVGNAIILVLFAKSGKLSFNSPPPSISSTAAAASYDEILGGGAGGAGSFFPPPLEAAAAAGEEVYEDKEVCVEIRALRRSRSAGTALRRRKAPELRRSESVAAGKGEEIQEGKGSAEDEEEFRRTIEAFIARQQRFLRDEEITTIVAK